MAPQDNLSPPGSSTYSSGTMYVGDGTWDASRNDFLLPNLVGLNFETMRYNGPLPHLSLPFLAPKPREEIGTNVPLNEKGWVIDLRHYHNITK